MPAAEGSEKAAVENHHYIFEVKEICQRNAISIKISQGEFRCMGVGFYFGHTQFLKDKVIDRFPAISIRVQRSCRRVLCRCPGWAAVRGRMPATP